MGNVASLSELRLTRTNRKVWGAELRTALHAAQLRQSDLAAALGIDQSTVSQWINGRSEPVPSLVFAVEEILDVPSGSLSRHLGYVPACQSAEGSSLGDAILMADGLTPTQRRMLHDLWSEFSDHGR